MHVEEVECVAACDLAPVMQVNYEFHGPVTTEAAVDVIEQYRSGALTARTISGLARSAGGSLMAAEETRVITKFLRERPDDSWEFAVAREHNDAYAALEKALTMEPDALVEEVQKSGLRGRGGAGFGTGQKWSFLPKDIFPRYLAVNADEGEPATFKDHMLIERDPHQIVEGSIITAYAIQAHHAFIYLRGEFALGAERLQAGGRGRVRATASSARTSSARASTSSSIVHRGAGCYIAGDETGLLSSLEGERAMPRIKPPFPAVQGLYAAPTIVNNVETMSTVPHIVNNGGEWYAAMGVEQVDRHAHLLGVGQRRAARATTRSSSAPRSATSSKGSPAASAAASR